MYSNLSDDETSDLIDRETTIYENYSNIAQKLIPIVETRTGEFPNYINVELRSMVTHMARARAIGLSHKDKQKHIIGAERHMNRMLRDLYKDLCGIIASTATKTLDENKDAIAMIGEKSLYLHKVLEGERTARNLFIDAKDLDIKGCLTEQDEINLFEKYQAAYTAYCEFERLMVDRELEILEKAAFLTDRAEKPTKKWAIISIFIGIVVAIVFFLIGKFSL